MMTSFLNNADNKNTLLKKNIIKLCVTDGAYSISDLSKELCTSIPTITKFVGELMEEGFLEDLGKQTTSGGRKPSIYGLNPHAGYFVGVDVRRHHISIAITDFRGQLIDYQDDIPFILNNSEASVKELCELILENVARVEIPQEKIKWIASNRDFGMEYQVVITPKDEEPYILQDFSENKELHIPNGSGHCTITARIKGTSDIVQSLNVQY